MLDKTDLINFEQEMAELFNAGQIRAPIHLSRGNEDALMDIFRDIKPEDWVFSTHRSHYHALLKGVPPELVQREILAGRSICLNFPEYNFYSSAIVGGSLPQAVGVAMTGKDVWAFVGDMGSQTGIFSECLRFSDRNALPINFVIEDNGFSVMTPTSEVWSAIGKDVWAFAHYKYKNTYGHQGAGKNVIF
tara:strand:- start:2027 stop:2596 length:570 start_codon:yes stop_codon:yes gene_type:complete